MTKKPRTNRQSESHCRVKIPVLNTTTWQCANMSIPDIKPNAVLTCSRVQSYSSALHADRNQRSALGVNTPQSSSIPWNKLHTPKAWFRLHPTTSCGNSLIACQMGRMRLARICECMHCRNYSRQVTLDCCSTPYPMQEWYDVNFPSALKGNFIQFTDRCGAFPGGTLD